MSTVSWKAYGLMRRRVLPDILKKEKWSASVLDWEKEEIKGDWRRGKKKRPFGEKRKK